MKNYLFILISLFLFQSSYGQTYQYVPIPTANASWKITNLKVTGPGHSVCSKFQYDLISQDTVVNADTFHRLKVLESPCPTAADPYEVPGHATHATGYIWMIEKNKRIYLLDSLPLDTSVTKPYLDFSLSQVGQKSSPMSIKPNDTVMHIDTITVNGTLRKRIIARVFSGEPYELVDTMIEGIGSINFSLGFQQLFVPGFDDVLHARLMCFSVNNYQEYVYNNSACTDIWPLDVDNISIEKLPVFSPNPFGHRLTGSLPGGGTLRICNVSGMSVCTHIYAPGENIDLNTTDWQPGLYIATVESNNVKKAFRLVKL
ncbi:MAG TPA: T9SS type A sorting domain-containing protein [Flavipsychrobacter sp.]